MVSGPRVTNSREVETLRAHNLLSSLSQFLTLLFQSQVCLSMSKASPVGQPLQPNECLYYHLLCRTYFCIPKNKDARYPLRFKLLLTAPLQLHIFVAYFILYLTTSLQSPSVVRRKYSSGGLLSQSSQTLCEVSPSSSSFCLLSLAHSGKQRKQIDYALLFPIENIRSNFYVLISACSECFVQPHNNFSSFCVTTQLKNSNLTARSCQGVTRK